MVKIGVHLSLRNLSQN